MKKLLLVFASTVALAGCSSSHTAAPHHAPAPSSSGSSESKSNGSTNSSAVPSKSASPVKPVLFNKLPARSILSAAASSMHGVTTLSAAGTINDGAHLYRITTDVSTSGECSGTITGTLGNGQYIIAKGKTYLKGDAKFWDSSLPSLSEARQVTKLIGNRWLYDASLGQDSKFCSSISSLTKLSSDPSNIPEDTANEGVVTVGKAKGVKIFSAQASTQVVVSLASPHYLLRAVSPTVNVSLSNFDKHFTFLAPPVKDVLNASTLR